MNTDTHNLLRQMVSGWSLGPFKTPTNKYTHSHRRLWSHNSSDSWGFNNKLNLLIKNWWYDAPKKVSITGNCLASISHHGIDHRQVWEQGGEVRWGWGLSLKGFQQTAKQQLSDFSTSKPKRCFSNQRRRRFGTSEWTWGNWPVASVCWHQWGIQNGDGLLLGTIVLASVC